MGEQWLRYREEFVTKRIEIFRSKSMPRPLKINDVILYVFPLALQIHASPSKDTLNLWQE